MGATLSVLQPTVGGSETNDSEVQISIKVKKKTGCVLQPKVEELSKELEKQRRPKRLNHLANLQRELLPDLSSHLTQVKLLKSKPRGPLTYNKIVEYVNNSQEAKHRFGIKIDKIFYVPHKHEPSFRKFWERHPGATKCPSIFLWHGTPMHKVASILESGFALPKFDAKNKRLQGQGIYFADRASKSAQYSVPGGIKQRPVGGEKGALFLCDVFKGNTLNADSPNNYRCQLPDNYHSVFCAGKHVPGPYEYVQYMEKNKEEITSLLPLKTSVKNDKLTTYDLEFNEYIVYSTEQIKIMYLIFFTFTSEHYTNGLMKE